MRYGEFKFWPQVYELWWGRKYAAVSIDFSRPHFRHSPTDIEMLKHCSRRQ